MYYFCLLSSSRSSNPAVTGSAVTPGVIYSRSKFQACRTFLHKTNITDITQFIS